MKEDKKKILLRTFGCNRRTLSSQSCVFIFLFCFVFLIFFRSKALFYPPYWDAIVAIFTEAIWLSENKFNFLKLATEMSGYVAGGPRVYFFSIYPSFQAALMLLIKNQNFFLILNHLIAISLSSSIVVLLYKISRMVLDSKTSLLVCVLVFFNPLFLSQSYAINMEIPVLFFGLVSVYFFLKEKHVKAGVFLLLCFYIKPTAVLLSVALVVVFILTEFMWRRKKGILLLYCLPCILYIVQTIISNRFFLNPGDDTNLSFNIIACPFLRIMGVHFKRVPDIYSVLIAAVVLGFCIFIFKFLTSRERFVNVIKENKLSFLSLVFCGILGTIPFILRNFLPRYFLIGLPFMFFLLVWCIKLVKQQLLYFLVFAFLCFYSLNMYGKIYGRVFEYFNMSAANNGHLLERTLEYENDMDANLALIKKIEEKYGDKIVVASWPISHMLASSKFCYVKEGKKVISSDDGTFLWKGNLQLRDIYPDYDKLKDDLVWVYSENCFSYRNKIDLSTDCLLDIIKKGNVRIYIYKRDKIDSSADVPINIIR